MELDYRAIGKRIKIARIKADLTQERLAEAVEISPTHMSNIETGTTRVSLTAIVNLANALSVTVDDLLCDSVIQAKPQFEKDIAALLEDCDEYEIRMVRDMAQALKDTLRRDARLRK
ncbi:MAG: helix-turn-helix transcriptional regulator [Anaerosacchariphilus sp.]